MNGNPTEQALINKLAVNDRMAVEAIYAENYGIIQHYILQNNGEEEDARDIFQEGMIVLYENAKSEGFELNCRVGTYLYAVCRRLWLKRLQRADRVEVPIGDVEDSVFVEADIEMYSGKNEEYAMMEKAMAKVGEPCRSLLEAFYIRRLTMQEIAEHFGYTNPENAKNQKYKCLLRLRKIFFAEYKNGDQ